MKKFPLLCLILVSSLYLKANPIDSLKTDQDIANFAATLLNKKYGYAEHSIKLSFAFSHTFADSILSRPELKKWEKADLNHDGITDILINAEEPNYNNKYTLVIMGSNTQDCQLSLLDRWHFATSIGFIDTSSGSAHVIIESDQYVRHRFTIDTLTYAYNGFVEMNSLHSDYTITNIHFSVGPCFGSCPFYDIDIDSTGFAKLDDIDITTDSSTYLKSIPPKNKIDNIKQVLNFINFSELNTNYEVSWTDAPTNELVITYDNGKTKKISDYGQIGTYGLMEIYELFSDLYKNQHWVKR